MSSHNSNFTWSPPDNGHKSQQERQYYYIAPGTEQSVLSTSVYQDQTPRTAPQAAGDCTWMNSNTAQECRSVSPHTSPNVLLASVLFSPRSKHQSLTWKPTLRGGSIDPAMSVSDDHLSGQNDDVDNAHWQYATECIDNMGLPVAYQQDQAYPPKSPRSRAHDRVYDVVNADYPGTSSSSASGSGTRPSRQRTSRNQHSVRHKKPKKGQGE